MALEPEEPRRKTGAIEPLKDDLSTFSVDELGERIAILKAEIARCEAAIENKQGAASAAEAVFGKP